MNPTAASVPPHLSAFSPHLYHFGAERHFRRSLPAREVYSVALTRGGER
jgi:hypothetical protein